MVEILLLADQLRLQDVVGIVVHPLELHQRHVPDLLPVRTAVQVWLPVGLGIGGAGIQRRDAQVERHGHGLAGTPVRAVRPKDRRVAGRQREQECYDSYSLHYWLIFTQRTGIAEVFIY